MAIVDNNGNRYLPKPPPPPPPPKAVATPPAKTGTGKPGAKPTGTPAPHGGFNPLSLVNSPDAIKKDLSVFKIAKSAVDTFSKAQDAFSGKKPFTLNLGTAWNDAVKSNSYMSKQGSNPLGLGNLTRVSGYASTVLSALSLPSQVAKTFTDVSHSLQHGTFGQAGNKSIDDLAKTAKMGLDVTKGVVQITRDVRQFNAVANAAKTALNVTDASRSGSALFKPFTQIANKVAFQTLINGKDAAAGDASKIADKVVQSALDNGVVKKAISTVGETVIKNAAEFAAKEGVETAAKVAGKFAGRLIPGVNIAIAALDTAHAVETLRDPNASLGKKITSGITAIGSIAAATNIPIVSQAGGIVSGVSGLVEGFFFGK